MRVLRQRQVPRTEVMFVTIRSENFRPLKESNEQGCYNPSKLPDCILGYESLRLLIDDQ
jgi:hypothetical protein